jgi:hypothetical protein
MASYAIYSRCAAALRLPRGTAVEIANPDGGLPWIQVRSRYLPPPSEDVARDLLIEVRLEAPGLEQAVNEGLQAAQSQLLGLTAAANAYVANPVLVAAYETDPGVRDRSWIQRYNPPDHPIPPNTREISTADAGALMKAAEHHGDRLRFGRVLAFYREALRHAEAGSALLAVEYLHVTAETLTPLLRDQLRQELGGDEMLRGHLGLPSTDTAEATLLSKIRLREIYGDDNALRRAVERVSNGFEHGFEDLARAREVASRLVAPAADRIRTAVLRAAALAPSAFAALTAERFRVPTPLFNTEYHYIGTLRVSDETVLVRGAEPIEALRDWSTWVESSQQDDQGPLVTTAGSARGPEDGIDLALRTLVQRLPVGLPSGARVPRHRLKAIEVLEED